MLAETPVEMASGRPCSQGPGSLAACLADLPECLLSIGLAGTRSQAASWARPERVWDRRCHRSLTQFPHLLMRLMIPKTGLSRVSLGEYGEQSLAWRECRVRPVV